MSSFSPLQAFAGYGIELEYMIVDRKTLSVLPIADALLCKVAGAFVSEVQRGKFGWSNELVLHLIEIKNTSPDPLLDPLPTAFQNEVRQINRLLEPMDAKLMPTGMHPWMNPLNETHLWPHDNAAIYRAYDRIFDCKKGHGWANLQSMHLNLPFANDDEFARLHAAIRLVLPILPALAASSPIAEERFTGFMDFRMEAYRTNALRIPSSTGQVIPDNITSQVEYKSRILAPLYRDIAALDPEGVLQHEWINSRGAIPRFDRNAIEIRVIDLQECPEADIAIAAATSSVVKMLYDNQVSPLSLQQEISTVSLVEIMQACIRDAEQAVIFDSEYLARLGFPERRCEAKELWRHLIEKTLPGFPDQHATWQKSLGVILDQGPLARRITRAVGSTCERSRLEAVYAELCTCLGEGRLFQGLN